MDCFWDADPAEIPKHFLKALIKYKNDNSRMKQITFIFSIALSSIFVTDLALSHSGNTDQYGCQAEKKAYHCQNRK